MDVALNVGSKQNDEVEVQQDTNSAGGDNPEENNLFGLGAAILAVALFLWQAMRPDGWLEAAFGELALLFWAAFVLWLIVSAFAVHARQHWWVIATVPFALYPIAMVGTLLLACAQGNCI